MARNTVRNTGEGVGMAEALQRLRTVVGVARWDWNGCWIATKGVQPKGYCRIFWDGKSQQAHRVSYVIMNGPMEVPGNHVHHKCSQSACCNPAHLSEEHPQANTAEMFARKRYERMIAYLHEQIAEVLDENKGLRTIAREHMKELRSAEEWGMGQMRQKRAAYGELEALKRSA
jgi:hypothetical protein